MIVDRSGAASAGATLADVLQCARCDTVAPHDQLSVLVCHCGGPLVQHYRAATIDSSDLRKRPFGVWRYLPLLPIRDPARIVTLGEGATPLVDFAKSARELGLAQLLVKDEGRNPTGTFKVRGASVAISRLGELGYKVIAMPTVGSGGSAWSAYAARADIEILVGFPSSPPVPAIGPLEAAAYGAQVSIHEGGTGAAFTDFEARARAAGAAYVGAFREPYRLEGEKTICFEIIDQLNWEAPDWIAWPTGGAVGLVGLAKGFAELAASGLVSPTPRPGLLAVQHTAANPIVEAIENHRDRCLPSGPPGGLAPGLWVNTPFADDFILASIAHHPTLGETIEDDGILRWMRRSAREEGLLIGPEGAGALAAVERAVAAGRIARGSRVVVVNTSSGLRYPHLLAAL